MAVTPSSFLLVVNKKFAGWLSKHMMSPKEYKSAKVQCMTSSAFLELRVEVVIKGLES